jgi:hypothetical protein
VGIWPGRFIPAAFPLKPWGKKVLWGKCQGTSIKTTGSTSCIVLRQGQKREINRDRIFTKSEIIPRCARPESDIAMLSYPGAVSPDSLLVVRNFEIRRDYVPHATRDCIGIRDKRPEQGRGNRSTDRRLPSRPSPLSPSRVFASRPGPIPEVDGSRGFRVQSPQFHAHESME